MQVVEVHDLNSVTVTLTSPLQIHKRERDFIVKCKQPLQADHQSVLYNASTSFSVHCAVCLQLACTLLTISENSKVDKEKEELYQEKTYELKMQRLYRPEYYEYRLLSLPYPYATLHTS